MLNASHQQHDGAAGSISIPTPRGTLGNREYKRGGTIAENLRADVNCYKREEKLDQTTIPAIGGKVLWIKAELDREKANIIIDTGAAATIVGGAWLRRMQAKGQTPRKIRQPTVVVSGLSGSNEVGIDYEAEILLSIGSRDIIINALVAPGLQYDCLMAYEMLETVEFWVTRINNRTFSHFLKWNLELGQKTGSLQQQFTRHLARSKAREKSAKGLPLTRA